MHLAPTLQHAFCNIGRRLIAALAGGWQCVWMGAVPSLIPDAEAVDETVHCLFIKE